MADIWPFFAHAYIYVHGWLDRTKDDGRKAGKTWCQVPDPDGPVVRQLSGDIKTTPLATWNGQPRRASVT